MSLVFTSFCSLPLKSTALIDSDIPYEYINKLNACIPSLLSNTNNSPHILGSFKASVVAFTRYSLLPTLQSL